MNFQSLCLIGTFMSLLCLDPVAAFSVPQLFRTVIKTNPFDCLGTNSSAQCDSFSSCSWYVTGCANRVLLALLGVSALTLHRYRLVKKGSGCLGVKPENHVFLCTTKTNGGQRYPSMIFLVIAARAI